MPLRNSAPGFTLNGVTVGVSGFTTVGNNRVGLVKVGFFGAGTIDAVTWGGVDILANVIENNVHDLNARKRLAIFFIVNPPTDASDVEVTKSAGNTAMSLIVEAHDDVDQTTPYGDLTVTTATAEETANPAVKTITADSGKIVTDVFFMWTAGGAGTTWALGGDQTQIQANLRNFGGGANTGFFGSSYATSDGSVDMTWDTDHAATNRWAMAIISLNPAAGGATEEGDFSGPAGFGATFSAAAIAAGSLNAGIGCGATFGGRADAIAFVTAGLGAGDAAGRVKGVVADAAAEVLAGATTSALADAIASVLAAAELGEQWAGQALTAASLAAAGEFGAEFTEATSGTTGAVVAGTDLAATFVAAAEALAATVAGASLDDAFAAIAMAMAHVTAGAVFGAAFSAVEDNQQDVEVGLSLSHAIDVAAIAFGSLAAGVGLQVVLAAVSVSRAEIAAGATFGAAFSAVGGVGEILPPAHASLRPGPRTRDLRVPPRIRSTRIN